MGMASNDYEEEYLWGATFTAANKEFTWSPEESEKDGATEEEDKDDPSVKPGHRLLLKTAVLMPEAKKDDVCILQVESEGYNKAKVITPIVAMRGGTDHQLYVDVLVPHKATFKLVQGEGPIHLVGSHCVNFYGYRLVIISVVTQQENFGDFYGRDVGGDYSDDETDNTMDEESEEQQAGSKEKKLSGKKESPGKAGDNKTPVKESSEEKKKSPGKDEKKESPAKERENSGGKKRKASEDKANSAEKKKKGEN